MENTSSRRGVTTTTTLISLTMFAVTSNLLAAAARQMGVEYGMSEAMFVKWGFPIQFLGFTTLCLLGGAASDRFGKRNSLLVSCLCVTLGCFIWVLAPNIWVLYIGAIFIGMGGGVVESVSSAGLTDLNPTQSKLYMNLSQIFFCLGAIGVSVIVGYLAEQGTPWRAYYIGLGIFAFLVAIGFVFSRFPKKESETQADTSGSWDRIKELLPFVWLPSLGVFLYVYAETAFYAFGPNYLRQLGASEQIATYGIAVFWITVVIGRVVCSFLPQKQTYEPVICGLFLLAGISTLCQNLATGWQSGMVLIAVTGLACAGTWPLMVSMVAVRNIKYSGTASGIAIAVGSIGCILSPLTLGTVFDQGHAKLAFTLLGVSFLLGMCCIIGTYFQYRKQVKSSKTES